MRPEREREPGDGEYPGAPGVAWEDGRREARCYPASTFRGAAACTGVADPPADNFG